MFIPLKDESEHRTIKFPSVTVGLIVLCCLVYLWQVTLNPQLEQRMAIGLGVIPAALLSSDTLPSEFYLVPDWVTLFTYQFLHADIMHLGGNMLFLWVFGDNIEDAMGHKRFVFFYLLGGAAAGLAHAAYEPGSITPLIGASGSISAILGAYFLLHPMNRVLVLVVYFVMRLRAYILLPLWFGWQAVQAGMDDGMGAGVAWLAHIGGFVAGAILILPFRYKHLGLLEGWIVRRKPGPWDH